MYKMDEEEVSWLINDAKLSDTVFFQIKACQNIEPHENNENIKSKAVQLYSNVLQPVKFNKLQCNTNLNLPPSNWLTSSSPVSYNLHQALYNSPGFARWVSCLLVFALKFEDRGRSI